MCNTQVISRLAACVLVLALAGAEQAIAQGYRMGVSSALPSPISSLDLARYSSMMLLTAEQLHAIGIDSRE